MKLQTVRSAHEVAYQDLATLLRKHATDLSAIEMLAVAANMLGKLVAMQDQRTTTPEQAMEIVARNMALGNTQAVAELMKSEGAA